MSRSTKKRNKKSPYSPNVILLGFVSLCTDLASEMLYPLLPIVWSSAGFSVQLIGVIEGLSEAVSGLSKLVWGWLADKFTAHKKLIIIGYGLSAVMKPFFGVTTSPIVPLAARNLEQFGKAIRGAPRDAILAAESNSETRVRVFGFHRALDTVGAAIGPLITLAALYMFNNDINKVFLLAIIPGLLALWLTLRIRDDKVTTVAPKARSSLNVKAAFNTLVHRKDYRNVLIGLLIFSIINSSDVFIILRLREMGLSTVNIVIIYTCYNLIYAAASKSSYHLVKSTSLRFSILVCMVLFACTYATLSLDVNMLQAIAILPMYGVFAGLFEVTSKSWIVEVTPTELRATGLGLAGSVTSLGFLVASTMTGALWVRLGGADTLGILAVASVLPFLYFSFMNFYPPRVKQQNEL